MRQAISLLMILLISAGFMAASATAEVPSVPGDLDGDLLVSDEELKAAEEKRDADEISEEKMEEIRLINERYPRTITDSAGRTVTIYKPLERVVVFNSATIEIMRSLNTSNIIVGVDRYTKEDGIFFPEMAGENIGEVGTTDAPDYEAVLEAEPEAVFVYATNRVASSVEIQNTLESADPAITVIRIDGSNPEIYTEEVENIGTLLDREEEAEDYLQFYRGSIEGIVDLAGDLSEEERPRVYLETPTGKTCANGSIWHQRIVMAGGNNIFENASVSYPDVDPESVIVEDSEIVIKICSAGNLKFGGYADDDPSEMEALREEMMSRSGWDEVTAVENGDVYVLSIDVFAGAEYFVGLNYLAKILHPDIFSNLDPEAIQEEYITRFQGLDYDLSKHGVFVCPEA
jgi:iron complex transport system substrate-binding protein